MFDNRIDAGRQLAKALAGYRDHHPVVLGLARGGVPVALEVARGLGAPLDVIVVRKIGAPSNPEFALGAVAPGVLKLNRSAVAWYGIGNAELDGIVAREREEMERRAHRYRGGRPQPAVAGKTVLLIDDGLATGASAQAAVASMRARHPARVVFGAPVCACDSAGRLEAVADAVVCVLKPVDFRAVSLWYRDFRPTTDDEVRECLARAAVDQTAITGREDRGP